MNIYFTLDPQIDLYQRSVYSFLDLFGFIGGIFELLKLFGYLAVWFFIQHNYYSKILSSLYHVKNEQKNQLKEIEKKNEKTVYGTSLKNSKFGKVIPKIVKDGSSVWYLNKWNDLKEEIKSEVDFDKVFNI